MRHFLASLLVVASIAALAPRAQAEAQRTSALGWTRLQGAEACIGTKALAVAVERRLGRAALVSAAQAELFVDGRIERKGSGFHAHLELSDARGALLGTRDLETRDTTCRALDDELALVIALLLDPDAALGPAPAVARPVPPPAVPVQRVPASVPVPMAPPASREPWRESISVGPSLVAGLLPKIGLAESLRGELVPPSFVPIEIGVSVWLDAQAAAPSNADKGATLSLAYGMLGLCPLVYRPGATTVEGCADVAAGAVRAVGHGFTSSNAAGKEAPVVQGILAGRVRRRLIGPLELGVGLGLVVPFTRARFFYVDGSGQEQELFRVAPVAGLVDATIGVAFP